MIEFEAQITVGIIGFALSDLNAKVCEGYKPFPDETYTPTDAVRGDILCCGIEDWIEWMMRSDGPKLETGIYKVTGKMGWAGSYDDAETEYENVRFEKVNK